MKHLVLILVFITFPFVMRAQSTVLQSDEAEEIAPQTKVLVIPFHEIRYYFSDCDKAIAEKSKLDLPRVRKSFMLGLDYATEHKFEKKYDPMNLAQMKDSVDKEQLSAFYDHVTYTYEAPSRALSKKQDGVFKRMKKKFKQIGAKREEKTLNEEESYTTLDNDANEYMRLHWKGQEYLEGLSAIYTPDIIVTVNQFEIKTDYAKCIDRDLGRFVREISVHFNVFRPDGKMLYGDVVTAKYESTSDNINDIITDNFGFLAEYIMQAMPKK
ncbi:MAG: hypothetical protein AAF570_26605 [Bacteroidota bacterium]